MITALCKRISLFLYTNGIISEDEVEICQYGQEITLSTIIGFVIVMAESFAFKLPIYGLVYYVEFVLLRQLTGGYHASTYFKCNLGFSIVTLLNLLCIKVIEIQPELYTVSMHLLLSIFSCIVIIIWSPVKNPNKPLSKQNIVFNHIAAILFSIIIPIVSFIANTHTPFSATIEFTLFSVAVLILFAKFKEGGGKHDESEAHNA